MQVILLEKVINLGNLGDVVRVKDGYARNFLIPQKQARRATEAAIKEFEARRAELEKLAAEKLAAAQAEGEKLNGLTLQLSQKAGVDGRLFGSVTNHDIAEALNAQGFKVEGSSASAERSAEDRWRSPGRCVAAHRCGSRCDRVGAGRGCLSTYAVPRDGRVTGWRESRRQGRKSLPFFVVFCIEGSD